MRKKYKVLEVEGSEGIEFGSDSPVGRRVYRAGDIIELDDKVHDVAGIMARGQLSEIFEAPKPIVEEIKETKKVVGE